METNEVDFGSEVTSAKPSKMSVDASDISKLLSGYDKPANVELPQNGTEAPKDPGTEYYVRGPKKGQPKPPKKPSISASVNPNPPDSEIGADSILTGILFLTLLDMFIPFVIVMLNNRFSKQKMNVEVLQLSKEQKKTIEPVADKVIAQLKLKGNPVIIFVLAYLGMMAMNFAMAKTISK